MDAISTNSEFEVIDSNGMVVETKKQEVFVDMMPLRKAHSLRDRLDDQRYEPKEDPEQEKESFARYTAELEKWSFGKALKQDDNKKRYRIYLAIFCVACAVVSMGVLFWPETSARPTVPTVIVSYVSVDYEFFRNNLVYSIYRIFSNSVEKMLSCVDGSAFALDNLDPNRTYTWKAADELSHNVVDYLLEIPRNTSLQPFVFDRNPQMIKINTKLEHGNLHFENKTFMDEYSFKRLIASGDGNQTEINYHAYRSLVEIRRDLENDNIAIRTRIIRQGRLLVSLQWNNLRATRVYLLYKD